MFGYELIFYYSAFENGGRRWHLLEIGLDFYLPINLAEPGASNLTEVLVLKVIARLNYVSYFSVFFVLAFKNYSLRFFANTTYSKQNFKPHVCILQYCFMY